MAQDKSPTADGLRKWVQHKRNCPARLCQCGMSKEWHSEGRQIADICEAYRQRACACGLDKAVAAAPRMGEEKG